MDPDETLKEIRRLSAEADRDVSAAVLVVSLVRDLDEWLSNGGFLPRAWAPPHVLGYPD